MQPLERPDAEQTVEVAAAPEAVWDLVSDITRTPEWSPVVQRCEWAGEPGPVAGARFLGHNRFRGFRWTRECVVTAAEAPTRFCFSTLGKQGEEQTRWRYLLEPAGDGTRVLLGFESITKPRWVRVAERLPRGERMSDENARQNLARSLAEIRALVGNAGT